MKKVKNDINVLYQYLDKKGYFENDLLLKSIMNNIYNNELFKEKINEEISNEIDIDKIKKDFNIKNKLMLDWIKKDLSVNEFSNNSDFNTIIYNRIITTFAYNYIQSGLENYKIEEKNDSYDLMLNGYRMEITLKKDVNLQWSVNKLKAFFKNYYAKNNPSKLITSISINGNELQLM